MSSPIAPAGLTGKVPVQPDSSTPATVATDASTADVTLAQALKIQQDSLDKVPPALPATVPGTTPGSDPNAVPDTTGVLTPADLAGLQLKSAGQRLGDTSTTTPLPTSPQVNTSGRPGQVLSGPDQIDPALPATGGTNQPALADPAAPALDPATLPPADATGVTDPTLQGSDPAMNDPSLPSADDILHQLMQEFYQSMFGQMISLQVLSRPSNQWSQFSMSNQGFRGERNDAIDNDPDKRDNTEHLVRKWVEMIKQGDQIKEVVHEQFQKYVTGSVRTRVQDIPEINGAAASKLLDAMQRKGLLPASIPDRDKICENIARAARETMEKLRKETQPD